MLEREFQSKLIKKIKRCFPECLVLKNDPDYIQGIPDLLILCNDKWAALECKQQDNSRHRPNQDYYVEKMKGMSYASFVDPTNEESVLDDLRKIFGR